MGMLPILPLLFPVMWVLLNSFGEARVLAEFSRASPAGLVRNTTKHTCTRIHIFTTDPNYAITWACVVQALFAFLSFIFVQAPKFAKEKRTSFLELQSLEGNLVFDKIRLDST